MSLPNVLVVLGLIGAAGVFFYNCGKREGEREVETQFKLAVREANGQTLAAARAFGQTTDWGVNGDGKDALVSNLKRLSDEVVVFRGGIDKCDRSKGATPGKVAEAWVGQNCGPVLLIPKLVTNLRPIDNEGREGTSKIYEDELSKQDEHSRLYILELDRGNTRNSFGGGCWEFNRHANLIYSKELEVGVLTDQAGEYEFKFELQDAQRGQSNVQVRLSRTAEPTTVRVDLAKVSTDVLKDLARFCIAIATHIPKSPGRANLRVSFAKAD